MGTFHMAMLLPFNKTDMLSFRDITESTQLPQKEITKQLQSLVETKLITTEVRLGLDSKTTGPRFKTWRVWYTFYWASDWLPP